MCTSISPVKLSLSVCPWPERVMLLLFVITLRGLFSFSDKSITVRTSVAPAVTTGVRPGYDWKWG